MLMRKILFLLIATAAAGTLHAQKAEDSAKTAIRNLFTGMINSDSLAIVNSFTSGAILQSIKDKDGKVTVNDEKITAFAHVIAGLTKGDADERITFDVVKVDGPLAIVWTPYQFYYKGKFSHCGVDSYQLVRIDGVWKIQYLIDTRRSGGCL